MRILILLIVSLVIAFGIYKSVTPVSQRAANRQTDDISHALKQPIDQTKTVLDQVRKQRDSAAKQF